ncbi:TadE/TadG family type IV pilus assembly protein [Pelagerythrobacter sp.]|uniref:TadE/TadG family type IV pilus assembly protein n=1 Tax=Pelagerythrobacter sp. TaxID=2800702 RepID=UPI0035B0DB7F
MSRAGTLLSRLRRSASGTALTEFALAAPLVMTAGLWGVESAHRAVVQMRVNQVAVLVADNASRVGENSLLGETRLYETDVNDVLYGAHAQTGRAFDLYKHGRVILSSLEVVPDTEDQQYIHWQRCKGELMRTSGYGFEGDGTASGIPGMGPAGEEIIAFKDEAVMFVEVVYDYQPLISDAFTHADDIHATAAFNVRDNRDLSQIYQRDPSSPDAVADCNVYDGVATING